MSRSEVVFKGLVLDRPALRAFVRHLLRRATLSVLGKWDAPLFRWQTQSGRNILSAAIYRAPGVWLLFVWLGQRKVTWWIKRLE